jgi:GntR family transcriptional regulator of arabinose operon
MLSGLKPGQKLPVERELAQMFSASRDTVRAVLDELEQSKVISRQQGRGTFLRDATSLSNERTLGQAAIEVLLPDTSNSMISQIVAGIRSAGRRAGLAPRVIDSGLSIPVQMQRLRELRQKKIAGLIIYPFEGAVYEPEFLGLIDGFVTNGTPVVFIDRYLPETDTCYVIPDYFQAAYSSVRHLAMLGHRTILHLSMARTGGTAGMIWLRGYRQALQDFGIAFREDLVRERPENLSHLEAGYRIVKEYIRGSTDLPFTAMTCAQESFAYGAYKALRENGLRVPEDVAIVSDDNSTTVTNGFGWTQVTYPWEELGAKAWDLIERQVNGGPPLDERSRHVILPVKLTIRQSCGMHHNAPKTEGFSHDLEEIGA